VAACWILLVILLGISRFFVVCTGPHCDGAIEFAHGDAACCEHDHDEASPHDHGDPVACGSHGCIDLALGILTAPPPGRARPESEQAPAVVAAAAPAALRSRRGAAALRWPTTGPPRPDHLAELRASTVLLL
jgi:hypothetical protein